ncbi:MAG: hypothetical protein K9N51_02135 [Candidatus Pacebacteria bacterium]|nr:hypothetical protein [Candidatus Paceibacterota bacterium]
MNDTYETQPEIVVETVLQGRQHNQCWFSPGMTVVPARKPDALPEVFIGAQQLAGNDMGTPHWIRTSDLGATWSPPMESQNLLGVPHDDHWFEKPHINLSYHRRGGRLLGLGSTHFSRDEGTHTSFKMEKIDFGECPFANRMIMTEWDFKRGDFVPWWTVSLPEELRRWHRVAWPRAQFEFPDGSVLVPFYGRETADSPFTAVAVMHADITNAGFACRGIGNLLRVDTDRGLAEPSVVHFGERFLLTIRHDRRAYVAVSADGLHYGEPIPWRFDTGEELGNFNTQQHWLARRDALYLVYNRRGELNNGVFRCRAPLYMARVDPGTLTAIRDSEQIVFPEKGARMGNFDVANVTDDEAWVVTGEWLEGKVEGMREGERFHVPGGSEINRIQYLGDLLLARIRF